MKRLLIGFIALSAGFSLMPATAFEPPLPHPSYLLVGNKGDNTISFIDLETGREIARRPVSGTAPHEIAISPSGEYAAVVNYGDASIDIFHTGYKTRLAPIDLGENKSPHGIVSLRNGDFLATTEGGNSIVRLTHQFIPPPEDALSPPDSRWIVSSIPTGQDGTHMVAISPDERIAYTANMQSGTVSRIDLETKRVVSVPAGQEVEGIAVTKDGSEVWASVRGEDKVVIFDAMSLEKLSEIEVGKFPLRIIVSPDGKNMVTSNLVDGTVTVLDVANRTVERTIRVSGSAQTRQVTLLFSEDGSRLYVAETGANKIAEINFATGELIGRLSGGSQGDGLAIVPADTWD